MKKLNTLLWFFVLVSICISMYLYTKNEDNKIRFVNATTLFNEFGLKKTLELKLGSSRNQRQHILDSFLMEIRQLEKPENFNNNEKIKTYNYLKQEYLMKKNMFDEDNIRQTSEYDKQIWNQLNQYISEFCREEGIHLLMGKEDKVSPVLFGSEKIDITKDLVEYTNKRLTSGSVTK